jgi:hypothetical protein
MLGTVMAEREIALAALAEISAGGERPESEGAGAATEEPAPSQSRPGAPVGFIPWPNAALAAYSARPRDLVGLQPGARPSQTGAGGRSDPDGAKLKTLKLVGKALAYACVIALGFVVLNREALFG